MVQFVNPYTFVPLVPAPEREHPAGHAAMSADRLSGVLKITLTARTPLLIGGFPATESGEPDLPRAHDGRAIIPGSGLMGATRSLHEALAGGCLRILDADWVPVHRHPANLAETAKVGLCLGVVAGVAATGAAEIVKLCSEWMWIPEELLSRSGDRLSRTGDKLDYQPRKGSSAPLPPGSVTGTKERKVLRARSGKYPQGVEHGSIVRIGELGKVAGECWVLLVTDTKARNAAQPFFAAGRIGADAPSYRISETTWNNYKATVKGADDLRRESLQDSGGDEPPWDGATPQYKDVYWPPNEGDASRREIGQRLPARSYLYVGQPVWVRVDRDERVVTEIRLSELWRYRGDGPVGERVGEAKPCTGPELCWSCRVFGSADTEGRGAEDLAVQKSYRGHVRIDDLRAKGTVSPLTWHLAPLSSPRPSAGQFYLDNTGRQRVAKKDTRPAATWGSQSDQTTLRPIRGRKFYWRTRNPDEGQHPRGKFREDHQSKSLSKKVALFPAGTQFEGRVCFDNLSVEDYGSLLAALDPRLMGWDGEVVSSLGGGKPFGFGSITIEVEPESVQTAAIRYLGEAGQEPAEAEAVRAFQASVPDAVRQTWRALQHALTFGFVADDLVWYPPGGGDDAVKGGEDFDKSFEFFPLTSGIEMKAEKRQLVALPDAAGSAAAQVLDSRGDVQPNRADQGSGRRGGRP